MKTPSAFLAGFVVTVALIASGCAKLKATPDQVQQNSVALMSTALALPAPDNSYAARDGSGVKAHGSNVQTMMQRIDTVALGLKESRMHLGQTFAEGVNTNSSLSIVLDSQHAKLLGKRDDAQGTIAYSYTLFDASYFTGTVNLGATSGNLTFPGNNTDLFPLIVTYDFSSTGTTPIGHVTVSNAHWNANLSFTVTYGAGFGAAPSKVKMTGSVSNIPVEGEWGPTGGTYKENNGTTLCFDAGLNNC